MSGNLEKIYKKGQAGKVKGPSGTVYDCVAGIALVNENDARIMRTCGWGNPPGGKRVVQAAPTPQKPVITEDAIKAEFATLVNAGTVTLLGLVPEEAREQVVEDGLSDWTIARAILGNKYGQKVADVIPENPPGSEPTAAPQPEAQPTPSQPEALQEPQAAAEGNGDANGQETYSRDDLEAMTIPTLLESFVDEANHAAMKKLKKGELVDAILGEGA